MQQSLTTAPAIADDANEHCPNCRAPVSSHQGYVTWCASCNWNVQPQRAEQQQTRFEVFYERLGRRMSKTLFEELKRRPVEKPRFTTSKVAALVIAAAVHLVTLCLAVLGLFTIVAGWPNLFALAFGGLCLGIAWVLRPRRAKRPANILLREQAPELFRVVDRVAEAMGSPSVDGIVIEPDYNAAYAQRGIPPKRYLYIGLPLFSVLTDHEKVAILAHELAHGVNGDPLRGSFVGSALESLFAWSYIVRPGAIWDPVDHTLVGFLTTVAMVPVNLVLLGLSNLFALAAYGYLHLLFRDSQRAEYLADHVAATVSGAPHLLSALEKLYCHGTFSTVVRTFALNKRQDNFFTALQQAVSTIPDFELERLRRAHLLEGARLDATHPPTSYRVELLRARTDTAGQPNVVLTDFEAAAFNQALAEHQPRMQSKLIENYRSSLHYG